MVQSPRSSSARMRGGGGSYPLRHRIIPARMERMAFDNPADAEPRASERAMARDGLVGVARARRLEATLREHEMRQRELVPTNESHYDRARQSLQCHGSVSTAPVNSARSTDTARAFTGSGVWMENER